MVVEDWSVCVCDPLALSALAVGMFVVGMVFIIVFDRKSDADLLVEPLKESEWKCIGLYGVLQWIIWGDSEHFKHQDDEYWESRLVRMRKQAEILSEFKLSKEELGGS